MKKIYTTLLLLVIFVTISYTQKNSHSGNSHHHKTETKQHKIFFNEGTLVIEGIGELEIFSTGGSEVIIESEVEDHEQNERSKGLKPLNSAGIEDNTEMGISAIKNKSTLTLTQISSDCNCDGVKVYVPQSIKISINNKSSHGNSISIDDIANEIVISTLYQNIKLNNITGPMSIKTVYGEVEADFTEVSQNGSISINAVYGLVDVSLPKNTKANLELSASYGEILSDMNVQVDQSGDMQKLSSTRVKGNLNGGGVLINLKSSYDNIYLREK